LNIVKADPLTTISSGSLLIVSPPSSTEKILRNLEKAGIKASKIGEILEDPEERVIVRKDGKKMRISGYIKENL